MIDRSSLYSIGQFRKPHGTGGELSLSFNDDAFARADDAYVVCLMDGIPVPFFIDELRFRSDRLAIVKLAGVDTTEQARRFTNAEVYLPLSMANEGQDENEISLRALQDFTLTDVRLGPVGRIVDIDDSTLNTLFIVENNAGEEILIPAHNDLIEHIDIEERQVVMQLPEGLLE